MLGWIVALSILYLFILFPLYLLLRCLFDRDVGAGLKIGVLLGSFILFPLPSFAYGAFVLKNTFSRVMIVITVLLFIGALVMGVLGLFSTENREKLQNRFKGSLGTPVESIFKEDVQEEEPEDNYSGENTYRVEDTNVFISESPPRQK